VADHGRNALEGVYFLISTSLVLSLALGASPTPIPERYQHTDYQRLERRVPMRASERYLLLRRGSNFSLDALEKRLVELGETQGLSGYLPLRDGLIEIDLGEASDLRRLLRLAGGLQQSSLISAHFPVWTRQPDGRAHVDERVVLRLRSGDDEQKLLRRYGLQVVQRYPNIKNVLSVRPPKSFGGDAIAAARYLQASGAFAWAEPDWIFDPQPLWIPSDPQFESSWHQLGGDAVGSVHAPQAWDVTRGAGVVVGVIDSGTQADHPDLEVFAGYDLIDDDFDASPECIERPDGRGRAASCPDNTPYRESHGTAVSGLVAARSNDLGGLGVCPECRLLSVRMIGVAQRRVSHAEGLRWLMAQNAGVVNNSWGPGTARYFPMGIAEEEAISEVVSEGRGGLGMLLLYAAGNDSLSDSASNPYSSHPDTLTVSGSTQRDDFACYSNYGPMVDVAAPTKGCSSDEPGLRTADVTGGEGYNEGDFHGGMGGTSGACPVASGVAALIIAANPELTGRQVRLILQASAIKINADKVNWQRRMGVDLETLFTYDESGHSVGFGYGRVDAAAAVQMAQNFTLLGSCTDNCAACRDGVCASACDSDIDCPGASVCSADDEGLMACVWPEPDLARVGASCSEACETCLQVASTGRRLRNLCTKSCSGNAECPGGWICAPVDGQQNLCVPGFAGCGSSYGDERCDGDVRVLDGLERPFCSCPCFAVEGGDQEGFCPANFHCGRAECTCTRFGRGGSCQETTCSEVTGGGNFNPVCFPDVIEDQPCDEDQSCGIGRICVENECRDDPYFCPSCALCERHSDCGSGNWCTPVDGRNVCLVSCGADDGCPGDSICRSLMTGGRQRSFCLNDPERTSEAVCPADYICRYPEGRCRVAADCPTRDHWCDDQGDCRLDDGSEPEPEFPTPTVVPTGPGAPVSGCSCGAVAVWDFGLWLVLLPFLMRRRLGGLRNSG
jgi:hypothetical protein